ncbi:galactose oxidase [Wilcoxina mikolae CBS 423.85]|nr:galactose oxidase [Wilcoxina mikolae CBS 423.85]
MRPGLAKARHTPGPESDDSGSRLSSLVGKVANQQQSAASSRSASANIANVTRSDSNSSTASTSTTAPSTRTTTPSVVQQKQISPRDRVVASKASLAASARPKAKHPPSLEPPIPDPSSAPKVEPAPSSGMYWYKAPTHGLEHKPLRAHTCTLVGSNIYVFGGCDLTTCFNVLHVFDADSMSWSKPHVYGEVPPPLRAMTCTAVRNKLVIFGGGDGPTYYNDIYVFDTTTSRYTRPPTTGGPEPCRRRAHTACLYKNGIYVFGGGDGVRALNDVWRLDVADLSKPSWKVVSSATPPAPRSAANSNSNTAVDQIKPSARGYHTANMVGSKLIIFGGSDGDECFKDVWVFDVETTLWRCVEIKKSFSRLSHSATVIGSYLFVVGGHDGVEYSSEVLLLNLVTMQWDRRKVYGMPPSGRGYHCAVLYDSRLFIIGGFDGHRVFNDTYILELAVSSYYSQISHFSVVVNPGAA